MPAESPVSPLMPIIDAHVHFFDPTRPGGIPWPEKSDTTLYKPALPDRYHALSAPFGVMGCIAVEASPIQTDNDWLLQVAARHPLVLGIIGNLVPYDAQFATDLDRLHHDPLFLGIRYGNLWNRDLLSDLSKPGFVQGLRILTQAGLVFESANPDPRLIRALLNVADQAPGLRIVVDHLPNAQIPTRDIEQKEFEENVRILAQYSHAFVKLSEVPVVRKGQLERDPAFYHSRLEWLWALFGEDRVIFGSDWPNSDHVAPFADTFSIIRRYMSGKTPEASDKFFRRNSAIIYRWKARYPGQLRHS